MLQLFRNFFKSKLGVVVTLAFLVLIALAFASSDVANTSVFGGVAGGDRVAVVGDERIDQSDLTGTLNSARDRERQNNPTLTMESFIAAGGLDQVLDGLLQRAALAVFGKENGMRAGDRLVDSEIVQIPAFRGADGNFSEEAFRATLAQQGLSESLVRDDLAMGLMARQLVTPITFMPMLPDTAVNRYAAMLRERRHGSVALLPSAAFAPQGEPTNAQLQAFYQTARDNFIRPERRVIRYATFGEEALGDRAAPTPAQISQRYQRDRAQYAASEQRRFTQLVVPTQAAAQAIVNEVRGGKSLDVAAREKTLATTAIGPVTRQQLTSSASAAVAQAAFAAQSGAIATPARGGLGWYVLRVDAIERQPGKTLAQATPEISAALAAEQRRAALADLTARIEDEFDGGSNLGDIARELKLQITATKPATADGKVYGSQTETLPPVLGRVLPVAFEMEEGEPQLADMGDGQTFVVFDVSEITPSAVAPLNQIRTDVVAMWRRDEGSKGARAAADRILGRIAKGTPIAEAVAAERKQIPAPSPIDLGRDQLAQMGQVPSSMALFFSMAAGTVKKLEGPDDAGWYVVQLDRIVVNPLQPNDPLIGATLSQLGRVTADEYVEQFVKAAQREVGVERNQAAIDAVVATLTGNQTE